MKTFFRRHTARITVVLALVALALTGISFWIEKSLSDTAYTYKVSYTPNGFAPALLSIPIGSRVAFTNTTDTPLLVASDPYPSRTDYPQFVASKTYNKNETYFFTFTKAGTFGYDNDKKISDRGFVQVTDPSNKSNVVDEIMPSQRPALTHLITLFKPNEPDSIFAVIDAIESDPSLTYDCHELGHSLGHRAYELYGFSAAMTYNNPKRTEHAPIESICTGGFMHGVLEEVIHHQPELIAKPNALCANVPATVRGNCFHGLGHAFMFYNRRDISTSLNNCRSVGDSRYASRCFEGVWMELYLSNTDHSGPGTLNWDASKPLEPCIAALKDAKRTCFVYASVGYLLNHGDDIKGAIHMCLTGGLNKTDTDSCLKGNGYVLFRQLSGIHLEKSEGYTAGMSQEEKTYLYSGILSNGLLYRKTKGELSAACKLLAHDSAVCLSALADDSEVLRELN